MPTSTQVRVEGLSELGEAMRALGADMAGKVARSMTAAGATVIKRAAQSKAPVDTGNLKKNVVVKRLPKSETNLSSEHIVTVRQGKLTEKQRKTGLQDAFYARFVEFGTVNAPAQPFLRPAFDENGEKALQAMIERGRARIEKAR